RSSLCREDTSRSARRPHEEPVHQHLIVDEGIFMLENLNLEELSREKVYQFLFICIPLRVRGATASPVNPLAIA
ncbi:MAG: cyclase family protein, partial [Nitrososphaerota archaeon]